MPRPSDVYATLGAPGVYQATPCTPSRLPNVYVVPPEEDNQDVYCLFHSGSVSPTTFESFYRHPVYTQRDPGSPTFTDLTALDHALSYFQPQFASYTSAMYGPRTSWELDERIPGTSRNFPRSTASSTSSRSSLSDSLRGSPEIEAETNAYSNARHLVEADRRREEQWQDPSKPASRRSSIFGDRPPDYQALESCVREDQPVSKKSQTMTLRGRAAIALKGLGDAMTRRTDAAPVPECGKQQSAHAVPAVHGSWFEPNSLRRRRSRLTRGQLLSSDVGIQSVSDLDIQTAPSHPSSSVRDSKLDRRRSMTQLFGLGRTSMESVTQANNSYPRPDLVHPAARSSSSLASPVGESKLSKRKSMTQLFGLGRGLSSTESSGHTIVAVGTKETCADVSDVRVAGSRILEGPYTISARTGSSTTGLDSERSDSPVSPVTAPHGRRKSFLSKRSFSFLDLHRRFATDHGSRPSSQVQHTSPTNETAHFSPDSLSERTNSSSSVAASTECEQTIEDDMSFSQSHIPAIMRQGNGALKKQLEPSLLSRAQLDFNETITFSPPFGLEAPDDDVKSETEEDPPTLELAVRLDSLTFDQLVFDPESFTGAIYD